MDNLDRLIEQEIVDYFTEQRIIITSRALIEVVAIDLTKRIRTLLK